MNNFIVTQSNVSPNTSDFEKHWTQEIPKSFDSENDTYLQELKQIENQVKLSEWERIEELMSEINWDSWKVTDENWNIIQDWTDKKPDSIHLL